MISKGAFLAGGLAALLFVQSEAQAGYIVQYENSMGDDHGVVGKQNDTWGNSLYFSYSEKINDNWSFVAETLNEFALKGVVDSTPDDNVDNLTRMDFTHKYIRMNFKRRNITELGGWKFNFNTRYILPTNIDIQNQYSFGLVTFRPELEGKILGLDLVTRLIVGPNLTVQSKDRTAADNFLGIVALELIPSFQLSSSWSLQGDFLLSFKDYYGEKAIAKSLYSEVAVAYKSATIKDWEAAWVFVNNGTIDSVASTPSPFGAGTWNYALRLTKEF